MERLNHFAMKYLIYCSPLMIIGVVGRYVTGNEFGFFNGNGPIYQVIGFFVMSWFILLAYYFFALVFNERLKDKFVRRLTGLRENDEREAVITGAISKRTFVSMIATLALLLFLSSLRIDVYRASENEIPTGKRGTVSLGFDMDLVKAESPVEKEILGRTNYFRYRGLPLSTGGTILLVFLLELGLFFYFSKKEFVE